MNRGSPAKQPHLSGAEVAMEWLELPDQGDAERNRRARVLVGAVVLALIVGVTGSAIVSWLTADPTGIVVSTVSLVGTSGITIGLLRNGRLELASHLFVASFWFAGLGTMAQYGGIGGFGANAVITAVIAAALLLPWRSTVIISALSIVAFASYAYLEVEIVRDPPPGPIEKFFVVLTGFTITVVFLFLSVRSLEEALHRARTSQERLEALIDAAPDAILTLDEPGIVRTANAAVRRLLGVEEDALVGRALAEAVPGVPDTLPAELASLAGPREARFEWMLRHQDGRTIPVEAHARHEGGPPAFVQLVVRDISDRLATERVKETIDKKLRESRRLESLGQLAGGVAHDFNNVLTAILSFAELTRERSDMPAEVIDNMDTVIQAGNQAASLTRELLAFARRQVLEPRIVEVNDTIGSVEGLLRQLLPENFELDVRFGDPGHVNVDPAQLEQVVMNLVVNSRDAMPEGGRIAVETDPVVLREVDVALLPDVDPGTYVRITITDTGSGMDETTISKVFEPFFTTKDQHAGTGLGLATVHGIVKQSGGHIFVESEVDRGSSFRVYLPSVDAAVQPVTKPRVPVSPAPGGETLLAVDDNDLVLKTTATMLRRLGYRVLVAMNGAEALEVLAANPDIRLLVTDMVMPGMSGVELATRARHGRPDLNVLLMSGYTESALVDEATLDEGIYFVSKPFTPKSLGEKVRWALDNQPETTNVD